MTWFRVDDQFHDHPKVRKLRRAAAVCNALQDRGVTPDEGRGVALGVWVACGSWAGCNLSDGFVPAEVAERFDPSGIYVELLVEVGLWRPETLDGESGYRFHEWDEHQPTREKVLNNRADTARRVAKHRAAKKTAKEASDASEPPLADDDDAPCNEESNALRNGVSNGVPTRPDPTRPSTTPRGAAEEVSPDRARDDEPLHDEPSPAAFPDPHPGRAVSGPTAGDAYRFVDAAIGRNHPHAVRTDLAIQVGEQLLAGMSRHHIFAALTLWLEKPHLGPRALPSLISEVIRMENKPPGKRRAIASETVEAEIDAAFTAFTNDADGPHLRALPRGA